MAAPPPGLHENFSEQGLWWREGEEDDQVAGTLTFDPTDGPQLKLLGVLGDVESSLKAAFSGERDEDVTIHGVTTKGKPATLMRAMNVNRQLHMPGIPHETWRSNLLAVGIHLHSDHDEEIFSKSYLRFEAIERWLEHRPFTDSFDDAAKSLTVKAQKPREVPFAHHDEFEVVSVGSLYQDNKPETRFTIDVFSYLGIIPAAPRSLNWHVNKAVRLQELAALCTGHFLPLTSLELRGPEEKRPGGGTLPRDVIVYARMIHPEAGTRPKHEAPLVSGPELIGFNSKAVQTWFDQYELFSPAIGLFFTVTGEQHMFTNVRLLLAIQALEVFHRRTSAETVMPPKDFPAFAAGLLEAIPAAATASMKDKLKGVYRYLNEPSLNQRLKSIVDNIEAAFGRAPAGFDKAARRKLVDTRNYYTHFSPELDGRTLDGGSMYWASRRIILLLTLLFLQRLGIATSDIPTLLKRHREFAQLWESDAVPV
jgi:hypothetical protein